MKAAENPGGGMVFRFTLPAAPTKREHHAA
jgi:hypothetical protein